MATKTSILIFYLRLAKNTQVILRYASWVTLAVVNIAGIVLTFMNIFQCKPTEAAWNSSFVGKTTCIPLLTEFICAAPVNIVTDLAILALPIPVLTGMRLPSRQKTILVLTFALGIFVTIVDVIRIYYLQQAIAVVPTGSTSDLDSRFGRQADFAYNASLSLMWSAVEVNVGMTVACIPTLKPLVLRLLPVILYDPDGTRASSTFKSRNNSDSPCSSDGAACQPGQSGLTQPTPAALSSVEDQRPNSADQSKAVTAMDFLTTPGMDSPIDHSQFTPGPVARAQTNQTVSTRTTLYENGVYFGFVNMTRPKSMLKTRGRETLKYCTLVSILFLLWGTSYGLLNTLNNAVAAVNNMTTAQTLGLTSAYFGGGYFFGPLLVGEWILRRDEHHRSRRHRRNDDEHIGGYKVTFIIGLCIYGIGTIIFWPSAVTNSFGGFMLSNFVVGFGLSVLEVGANSFLVLCGAPQYGESRLLVAQGVQAVGSVLSGLLAQKVFFKSLSNSSSSNSMTLINVQWTYLGITLLCVVLALFFYYMPLPEVSDQELEESMERLPVDPNKRSFGGLQLRTISLILAVLAQYMYVGGQESYSIFFKDLLISVLPTTPQNSDGNAQIGLTLSVPDYLVIAHTAFAASRFLAAYLTYRSVSHPRFPRPRTVLAMSVALCFLSSLLCVVLRPSNPNLLFIPCVIFFFAEGPIWPLLFGIGLRGQGRRTKRAAAFITMGGSGPAFFPFIMYGIINTGGQVQTAFIVVISLQVAMLAYPVFLVFVKDARLLVDPCPKRQNPRVPGDGVQEQSQDASINNRRHIDNNTVSGAMEKSSGILSKVSRGFGAKFIGPRRKSSPTPEVEHSEGNAGNHA